MIKDLGSISRALRTWFLPIVPKPASQIFKQWTLFWTRFYKLWSQKNLETEQKVKLIYSTFKLKKTYSCHMIRKSCGMNKYTSRNKPCSFHMWVGQSPYLKLWINFIKELQVQIMKIGLNVALNETLTKTNEEDATAKITNILLKQR